jgi:hypothetical protein
MSSTQDYTIETKERYTDEGAKIFVITVVAVVLAGCAFSLFARALGGTCMRQLSLFALRLASVLYAIGMFLVAVMLLAIWLSVLLSLLNFAAAPSTILELPGGSDFRNFWGFTALCALASFSVVLARFMCWAFMSAAGSFGVLFLVTEELSILPKRMSEEFAVLRCLHVSGQLDFSNVLLRATFVVLSCGASVIQLVGPKEPSAAMVLMLTGAPILLIAVGVTAELAMCTWHTLTGMRVVVPMDGSIPERSVSVRVSQHVTSSRSVEEGAARVSNWESGVYSGWDSPNTKPPTKQALSIESPQSSFQEQQAGADDEPVQQLIKMHYAVFLFNCLVAGFIAVPNSQGVSDFIGDLLVRLLFVNAWHFTIANIGARTLGLIFVEFDWSLIWQRWFNPPNHPAYTLNKDGSITIHKVVANIIDVVFFGFCLFVAPIMFCCMVYVAADRTLVGDFVIGCLFVNSILLCPFFLMLAHEAYLRATRSIYVFFTGCHAVDEEQHLQQGGCEGLYAIVCCTRDPTRWRTLFQSTSRLDHILRKSFTKGFGVSVALILFVVVSFTVFWSPLAKGYQAAKAQSLKTKPISTPVLKQPGYAPYSICSTRWLDANLDVYDLALFAHIAYADDKSTDDFLAAGYPNWVRDHDETHSRVRYQVFVHNETQDHVITVRGTELAADWFQNFQLWGQASIYEMTIGSIFVPPLVSLDSVQRIVKATGAHLSLNDYLILRVN